MEKDLTPDVMRLLARALAVYFQDLPPDQEIIIGRDNRASSPLFRDILVEELVASGMKVVDLGEVITPIFYFAPHQLGSTRGAMITASHNPGEFNGLKVLDMVRKFKNLLILQKSLQAKSPCARAVAVCAPLILSPLTWKCSKRRLP